MDGNVSDINWNEMSEISLKPDHKIGKVEPLFAKIESSVIKIIPKNDININLDKFEIFTREIFQHKRKKLSNFIKERKIKIDTSFDHLINKRAEDLNNNELMKIFRKFYNS